MKRILMRVSTSLLATVMVLLLMPLKSMSVFAATTPTYGAEVASDEMLLCGKAVTATVGQEVEIPITLKNNRGFSYLSIKMKYSNDVFEFVSVQNGNIISSLTSSNSKNPLTLVWVDGEDSLANGNIATLRLKIKNNVAAGVYTISTFVLECYDADENDVVVCAEDVIVSVVNFGDANGDGAVNGKDATRLTRYLANYNDETGVSTVEVFAAADVNGDGVINGKDATRLTRYLANYDEETGTSTVVLGNYEVEHSDFTQENRCKKRYTLTVDEDNTFSMYVLTTGSNEDYSFVVQSGMIMYISEYDIYFLDYSDESATDAYVRLRESNFEFCSSDGIKSDQYAETECIVNNVDCNLSPRPGNSTYGYYALANEANGSNMQKLYVDMYLAVESFACSKISLNSSKEIATFCVSEYQLTVDEAIAVWKVFYLDNPMYYWLTNSFEINGDRFPLSVHQDYWASDVRARNDQLIDDMISEFHDLITEDDSDLEIALKAHDFLLNRIDYAYKEDGTTPESDIWAHSIIGAAASRNGVCESYAKTFMALCLINNVDCIIVSGEGGNEGHAWNLVQINGQWYGVDVTWDETNAEQLSYACFGMSKSALEADHTADYSSQFGIEYLYMLPTVCDENIQLVKLYKNDSFCGIYQNIDSAFEAMTDKDGNYEIVLFEYEFKGGLFFGSSTVKHSIKAASTPSVASVRLTATTLDLGNGYYMATFVYIENDITFNSSFVFDDVSIEGRGKTLDIGPYECRFEGWTGQVHTERIIGCENSKITALCAGTTEFFGTMIDVDCIECSGITIHCSDVVVNTVNLFGYGAITFYGDLVNDIYIGELYANHMSFSYCEGPQVTIGDIYAGDNPELAWCYITANASGHAGELLPKISVTGNVIGTKLYYTYHGLQTSSYTDMDGNEVARFTESDFLDPNVVIIAGDNLSFQDFYAFQEQTDIERVPDCVYDVSQVLEKSENGDFVFMGWPEV